MTSHQNRQQLSNLNKPTAVWIAKDLLNGKIVSTLTLILKTSGCSWDKCTMCGYTSDSAKEKVSHENLLKQFEYGMKNIDEDKEYIVKIFTSGSFLDKNEIGIETINEILSRLSSDNRVKKVIIETRPEYVSSEILSEIRKIFKKNFEIAIGLETSNDKIRIKNINKGFLFSDFIEACNISKQYDITIKTYLLLKPIFLSEKEAIDDIINSIKDIAPYTNTISINLCNVQKGTLVSQMFENGSYRTPWLWSGIEVLKKAKTLFPDIIIISDPVGGGSKTGPHNCGKCDKDVSEAIRVFSLTQDLKVFDEIYCECKELWKKVVELENFTFGAPLVK